MFNEILRSLREEKKVSQKDVAEYLNISRQAYNFYELGKREPSYETLKVLSEYFTVSTDYLLGRTDEKTPYEPETIAAHKEGDEWSEEELQSIEEFKEFVRMRREQKKDKK